MTDRYGRKIDYMRISVTDRCNLRCRYCMPDGTILVSMKDILTYEEIETICRAAAKAGVSKLKITGGEPLVRRGCPELVGRLKRIPGIRQVTMTTNGVLLRQYLPLLLENGLDAVNISLDTLKPDRYQSITGKDELPNVLEAIKEAAGTGLNVKVNCVLLRGVNDGEWKDLADLTRQMRVDVRFIGMMPIGHGKDFEPVSNDALLEKCREQYPDLEKDDQIHGNGPAVYYRVQGAIGSIGFISAIHGKFCGSCNRLRLTSRGKLKSCLCFGEDVDLMQILRGEKNALLEEGVKDASLEERFKDALLEEGLKDALLEERLQDAFRRAVSLKPEGHRFEAPDGVTEKRTMVQIGG